MMKNLKNLELSIPSIDILESRKIIGGYGSNDNFDDGWWHGSPGEENNPFQLPEITITPDGGDYDYDPEYDPFERFENQDQDRDDEFYGGNSSNGGSHNQDNRNDGYNVNDATQFLRDHAHAQSQGKCAAAVRQALEAGGLDTTGRPNAAGDYDSFLPGLGFHEVDINGYVPQKGDIVVHEPREGHPYGHIAMYDGENWISDFIQTDMFGGSAYRNDPDYTIWRR